MTFLQLLKKLFIGLSILLLVTILWLAQHFYFPMGKDSHQLNYGDWKNRMVKHILPAADYHQFLIKVSFEEALVNAPFLKVNQQFIKGKKNDSKGRFWEFRPTKLSPRVDYIFSTPYS